VKKVLLSVLLIFADLAVIAGDETNLKHLETLAERGDLNAQIKLAIAYRQGIGVQQDYKTAIKWFTLAADQDSALAQYNLGVMHSFGLGIVPDYERAIKWYTLAAEQGNALAQYHLGRLYFLGKDVAENRIYAHMWATLASSNGSIMGEELTELLTELMPHTQIEKANRLRKGCIYKNYKDC